jgi:hypothetical protein
MVGVDELLRHGEAVVEVGEGARVSGRFGQHVDAWAETEFRNVI